MAEVPDGDKSHAPEPGQDAVDDAASAAPPEQAASPELDAEAQGVLQAAQQGEDDKPLTDHSEPGTPAALEQPEANSAAEASSTPPEAVAPPAEDGGMDTAAETAQAFSPPDLADATPAAGFGRIDLLDDVELDVRIELGRTEMYIEDVIRLGVGSVIELDKLAGDPVDVYVNDRLVARGEVLVLNDNFCVRVSDILSPIPELESA